MTTSPNSSIHIMCYGPVVSTHFYTLTLCANQPLPQSHHSNKSSV